MIIIQGSGKRRAAHSRLVGNSGTTAAAGARTVPVRRVRSRMPCSSLPEADDREAPLCGTFPRSMPHLSGARSLGHQPNVRGSFFVWWLCRLRPDRRMGYPPVWKGL